jgi:para-aminobenzoate synthetase/4-amino-4-deoxychorismate lyase
MHLVGWFSYELGTFLEPACRSRFEPDEPLIEFGAYRSPTIPLSHIDLFQAGDFEIRELSAGTDKQLYLKNVRRILEEIRRGNVYQVNFTFPLFFTFRGDPRSLFLSLARSQPVQYSAIIKNGSSWILSLSPELFFRIREDQIESSPMKGTISRGRTLEEDESRKQRLFSDTKTRAENLMIVDLIRNDLGRICETASVQVARLYDIHRLPTLFQMTSTITGTLKRNASLNQILQAIFPCGSVTGAPKISAMNIVGQLETIPRAVYCGGIGHLFRGQADFNVAIRTLTLDKVSGDNNSLYGTYRGRLGIGSGIVIDSDPEEEWEESNLKSTFLTRNLPQLRIIETMLYTGSFNRRSLHLNRMRKSADYFGFAFDTNRAIQALEHAVSQQFKGPLRIRLTLDEYGNFETEVAPIESFRQPVLVGVAKNRIDRNDRFRYHKTTERKLYNSALSVARENGLWDLVFMNRQGHVTEGSISNIFVRFGDSWRTPPVTAGLLPGVMRAEVINILEAKEEVFGLTALLEADEVMLTNSVHGVVSAQLTRREFQIPATRS